MAVGLSRIKRLTELLDYPKDKTDHSFFLKKTSESCIPNSSIGRQDWLKRLCMLSRKT